LAVETAQGVWRGIHIPELAETPFLFGNWEAAHRPSEIYRVDLRTSHQTRLTSFNVDEVAELDLPPYANSGSPTSWGVASTVSWRCRRPSMKPKKYPLLVLMHGGHASMWPDSITRRWNYHLLAQPGYVVLMTDYVGSTGYGEQFTRDILGDPLRGPADDINAAADEAIRRFSFIDGSSRPRRAPVTAGIWPTGSRRPPPATAASSVTPVWPAFIHNGPPATRSITASS
jgi:dipeptidyl aminopeptidase/acylaminoacyl peptidase